MIDANSNLPPVDLEVTVTRADLRTAAGAGLVAAFVVMGGPGIAVAPADPGGSHSGHSNNGNNGNKGNDKNTGNVKHSGNNGDSQDGRGSDDQGGADSRSGPDRQGGQYDRG